MPRTDSKATEVANLLLDGDSPDAIKEMGYDPTIVSNVGKALDVFRQRQGRFELSRYLDPRSKRRLAAVRKWLYMEGLVKDPDSDKEVLPILVEYSVEKIKDYIYQEMGELEG